MASERRAALKIECVDSEVRLIVLHARLRTSELKEQLGDLVWL
jgi:hypothetical protein